VNLYDALLTVFAIGSLPKLVLDRWKKKKKRPTFSERLGFKIPDPKGMPVIWIHAVSVGETKAAEPLFQKLRILYPDSFFLITNGTATGHMEAKRSLAAAHAFAFMPLDFSWIQRRWAKALRPTHFILMESDFWYNQLCALKEQKTKLILVSGKLSERSAARFLRFSFFSKKLFGLFDVLCVQNEEHAARFSPFSTNIHVTGNLKLDTLPQKVDLAPVEALIQQRAITLASTHAPEEEELLKALKPLFPDLLIYLAPRHPERFDLVEKILISEQISYIRWSQISYRTGKETVILIDSMGQLPICYSLSKLAIVAGSYTDKVGGHNLLEPCLYGCPTLFGPHTYSQKEFSTKLLAAKAGLQVQLSDLEQTVRRLLENPAHLQEMSRSAATLISTNRGAADRTIAAVQQI